MKVLPSAPKNTAAEPVDFRPARSTVEQEEELMCPACIATVALVVGGATSTGSLIALAVEEAACETGREEDRPDKPNQRRAR